jgi:hypothetical protein
MLFANCQDRNHDGQTDKCPGNAPNWARNGTTSAQEERRQVTEDAPKAPQRLSRRFCIAPMMDSERLQRNRLDFDRLG